MLVFGVIMVFQKNHKHFTAAGWALIGLGFLFLGIAYMKDGFESVSTGLDLSQYAVPGFRGLMIYAVIAECTDVVEVDITDHYERKVKPLYSAIMEFSTHAGQVMNPGQLERLIHLRRANWQIVTAINAMKELQKNIDRYMCAENTDIRQEYNSIRLNLAILLRALFISAAEVHPVQKLEQVRTFRARMEEEDIIANGTLDKLIREQRITPVMATSLMNDSAFSYDIQNNLINAAEILFANLYSTEKDMALDEAESDTAETGMTQAGQNEAMLADDVTE